MGAVSRCTCGGTYVTTMKGSCQIALFLLACLGACAANRPQDFEIKFESQLEKFINPRSPDRRNEAAWMDAREYIKNFFKFHSVSPIEQKFNTTVVVDGVEKEVEGANIIAVAQGVSNEP